jgi:hypothetical protein
MPRDGPRQSDYSHLADDPPPPDGNEVRAQLAEREVATLRRRVESLEAVVRIIHKTSSAVAVPPRKR